MESIFKSENITEYGQIPFDKSLILNERLMPHEDIKSITVFLAPYFTGNTPDDNYGISAYARVKDYHGYMKGLFERIIPKLEEKYQTKFYGFSDHSPLNEKLCAAMSGLGVIGNNSLLINKKYGSYVFIGILLSSLSSKNYPQEIMRCMNCGRCESACPGDAIKNGIISQEKCLSAISQKKNINEDEKKFISIHNVCWGCDKCQQVCPMNKNVQTTPIKYFEEHYLKNASPAIIEAMTDEEFNAYAFAWRKKQVILRNMHSIDSTKDQ